MLRICDCRIWLSLTWREIIDWRGNGKYIGLNVATRKCGNCDALQLAAARRRASPYPLQFRRPCQVWSRSAYPLPSYSVFPAEMLRYAVTLNSDPVTLTFDLEHSTPSSSQSNSIPNLTAIGQSAAELLRWPYDLEHVSCVALCSEIVCPKFKLSKAIRSWKSDDFFHANTSRPAMTLSFDPLTLKVCGRSGVTCS